MKPYEYVIVGAGIAGLHSAYKITQMNPKASVLVLEKNGKQGIGGRAGNRPFYGSDVAIGAGIGRKDKDVVLRQLLDELKIPTHEFLSSSQYSDEIGEQCNVKKTFLELKRHYVEESRRSAACRKKTFREFALPILGKEKYTMFTTCAGYTDYENEDAYDVFYYYGFEDNYQSWTGISVPWSLLIKTLCSRIGNKHIRTSTNVESIEPIFDIPFCNYKIHLDVGEPIYTYRVILATTVDSLQKLVPSPKKHLYHHIGGQPFLRIYGKFSKASTQLMKEYVSKTTIVPGPIHKIIPINAETGVHMIVYTDNAAAETLKRFIKNTKENRQHFCDLLEIALGIEAGSLYLLSIISFYWDIGTHYYKPLPEGFKTRKEFLKAVRKPFEFMSVVGEAVALNQGWVEGALE